MRTELGRLQPGRSFNTCLTERTGVVVLRQRKTRRVEVVLNLGGGRWVRRWLVWSTLVRAIA